jgi:hypothetical protein
MTPRARALVAVTVALVAACETRRNNLAPVATITVSPLGPAIVRATRVSFHATGVDSENDVISYRWDFGDQTTAVGPDASHVFPTVGTFPGTLTVSDGRDESTTPFRVQVENLVGSWDVAQGGGLRGEFAFLFRETTPALPGTAHFDRGQTSELDSRSAALDPRQITLGYRDPRGACDLTFTGQVSIDLRTINGTETCSGCGACNGQAMAMLLVKRPGT